MTSDGAAAATEGTGGPTGSVPFDTSVAHQARMYDYYLGGKDNYAADRAAAEAWLQVYPEMAFTARSNRAFLGRAVRYLTAEAGIRQFLDIGTGIPTAGNTHQVAQSIAPESRVVYVDYDPVVLAHARALLVSNGVGATDYIHSDLRNTGAILDQAGRLLDFTQPVAINLLLILHVIPDSDDPLRIVTQLLGAVPAGSYLVLSHVGIELLAPQARQGLEDVTDRMIQQRFFYRTREQIAQYFTGTDLVEPGLVPVEQWRPDPGITSTEASCVWCGVARKR